MPYLCVVFSYTEIHLCGRNNYYISNTVFRNGNFHKYVCMYVFESTLECVWQFNLIKFTVGQRLNCFKSKTCVLVQNNIVTCQKMARNNISNAYLNGKLTQNY